MKEYDRYANTFMYYIDRYINIQVQLCTIYM